MRIRIPAVIRHDGQSYGPAADMTIEDGLGQYFCTAGWAERLDGEQPDGEEAPENVTLDVANGQHGHEAENV